MILLDTDHVNVLQSRGEQFAVLAARMDASANLRDFEQVPGVRVENWLV